MGVRSHGNKGREAGSGFRSVEDEISLRGQAKSEDACRGGPPLHPPAKARGNRRA